MKYEGQNLITLPTIRTKRNLLVVSFSVLALKCFDADLTTAEILGVRPPASMFDAVAVAVTLYLSAMLIWHWCVDYQIWRSTPLYEPLADPTRQAPHIVQETLGLTGFLQKAAKETDQNNAIDPKTLDKIMSLHRTFQAVPRRARYLIIGGYLAFPLAAAAGAIVWIGYDFINGADPSAATELFSCCS